MLSSLPPKKNMELHHLKIFNTVATYQSYTKAAAELHISQPALSMQVKKLEDNLDTKLFDKIGNRIVLNQNGHVLFDYTQQIFDLIKQAENKFQTMNGVISGELSIGGSNTPGTYMLPKIIGIFKKQYPLVKVDLHISSTDEIASLIEKGQLDFAVNGGEIVYDRPICSTFLMKEELIIAASPQNPLVSKSRLTVDDFQDQELIIHESNSQLYKKVYDFALELGLESNISYILGNISSIKQAIEANIGISLIPYSAVALELRLGILSALYLENKTYEYEYNLIYNKQKYISPAGKLLMELIEKTFKETASGRKKE